MKKRTTDRNSTLQRYTFEDSSGGTLDSMTVRCLGISIAPVVVPSCGGNKHDIAASHRRSPVAATAVVTWDNRTRLQQVARILSRGP